MNLGKSRKIEQKYQNLVNGFIRELQNKLFSTHTNGSFYIIPKLVINLCLLFWYIGSDEFNPKLCGDAAEITKENKILTQIVANECSTCYGKRVIPSTSNDTFIWKLKMLNPQLCALNIGIDNAEAKFINGNLYDNKQKACYGYHGGNGYAFN